MKAAASDVSVKEAKIGNYTGVVNETDRTIKFTLPFGYKEKNTTVAPTITFNGVKSAPAMPADLTVGTNKVKAVEAKITVQPQDDSKDITYTVTAVAPGSTETFVPIQTLSPTVIGRAISKCNFCYIIIYTTAYTA